MAYASIASLTRTLKLLLTPDDSLIQSLVCDHKSEFLALRKNASYLEAFMRNSENSNNSEEMKHLEARIKEVSNVVEHTIQLRLTETLMANDEIQKQKAHERLCDSLQHVVEEIDCLRKESTKIQNQGSKKVPLSNVLHQDSSQAKHVIKVKKTMVGREKEREKMLEELRGSSRELKVIPIVGMGGIGKTTLADEVFNDLSIESRFDVRAWATVSQRYNVKDILLSLLLSVFKEGEIDEKKDEATLANVLQKSLKGRRYFIVLDDMWNTKAWDDVQQCFPRETNGSRVVLTTRNTEVARYARSENLPFQMGFMDQDESWNLLKNVGFSNEELPFEFESVAKRIADKCQGMPLTIVVVAGLLSKSERTIENWEKVSEDVKSLVTDDPDEQCLHVLGLSYDHLTSDLKACLLYFGIFPEDSEISVKTLLRLWMADGFLKLEKDLEGEAKDLEGEAEKCLLDLIDRSLVLISKTSLDHEAKIKLCKVHDLIYELCLREIERQNFFVMNDIVCDVSEEEVDIVCDDSEEEVESSRRHNKMLPFKRLIDNDGIDYGSYRAILTPKLHHHLIRTKTDDDDDDNDNNPLKRTRSIFYFDRPTSFLPILELVRFKLLRMLDLRGIIINDYLSVIPSLIWLRFIAMSNDSDDFDIPRDIFRLCYLQTFIVEGDYMKVVVLPQEVWELIHLRHLRLQIFRLPNPCQERYSTLPNIETVSGLSPRCCTKEVISGIRKVKKLRICVDDDEYESFEEPLLSECVLIHLHQLESLSFRVYFPMTISSASAFPATLKKLKLYGTYLKWEDLNIMGELPNLEVLKLIYYACDGEEWQPISGRFTRLKFLLMDRIHLMYWKATSDHFPVLERLVIRNCPYLEELPIEFSEIFTLQLIELNDCLPELTKSAKKIQEEQEGLENEPANARVENERIQVGSPEYYRKNFS